MEITGFGSSDTTTSAASVGEPGKAAQERKRKCRSTRAGRLQDPGKDSKEFSRQVTHKLAGTFPT